MENRINSIDILRGIAIILMIEGHIYQFWTLRFATMFGSLNFFIYIISPALFTLVAGISNNIFLNKRINKEIPKITIFVENFKRALFLFIVTTVFQLIFAGFLNMQATFTFFILYWSIFQLMAFSMIIFFFIPFLKINIRIILYPSLFILVFLMTHVIIFYNIAILYILIEGGSFPLLPWANFFIFGMAFSDFLSNISKEKINKILYLILSIGIILFMIYILWMYSVRYLSLELFFKAIGIFLILFSIFYYFSDIKKKDSSLQRKVVKWGQLSFSIYYIHWIMIAIGLFLFPFIIKDWARYRFSITEYIITVIIFFIVLEIILMIWKKFDYKLGLEWFMNQFTKKSLKVKANSGINNVN